MNFRKFAACSFKYFIWGEQLTFTKARTEQASIDIITAVVYNLIPRVSLDVSDTTKVTCLIFLRSTKI